MTSPIPLKFKPYARLLTMLGDQLIKDERIALVELIKNSYDADASWVKVTFSKFGDLFEVTPSSVITIEDDGTGMKRDVLENHWVSPATPIKMIEKQSNDTTAKGRKIQGEKGIGRFAILKLGKTVSITTRPKGQDSEYKLEFDFSLYDDEFLTKNGRAESLFLEDLDVSLSGPLSPTQMLPNKIQLGRREVTRAPHGTKIEIRNLRGNWNTKKVENVYSDLIRLQSIFDDGPAKSKNPGTATTNSFEILIYKDSEYRNFSDEYLEKLNTLIAQNSVLRIQSGSYDEAMHAFNFDLNGKHQTLSLRDQDITGLRIFRDYFGKEGEILEARGTKCGSFDFGFYVFDFSRDARGKHLLDAEERKIIKEHRIYLYRDGIRVYPYGDQDNDWLQIDAYRGTIAAGLFLSNDQVVGFVKITQKGNPQLRDKTSREGLIDSGNATHDFVVLLQLFLAWLRQKPYEQYRIKLEERKQNEIRVFKQDQVKKALDTVRDKIGENKQAQVALTAAAKLYDVERNYLIQRAETTEHLAGVGLSVETASHDIMSVMGRALISLDALIRETQREGDLNKDLVSRELTTLRGMLSFIETQLRDVQLLFKSSKQRRKDLRVKEILEKVKRLFASSLQRDGIELSIEEKGSPLIAKTTDAVLLQLFLNLFDNSVYWLHAKRGGKKEIKILLDGSENVLVFSDNGPGIKSEDEPFIFEPFYSGRGEEGRGLGLYIARQLLDRHDYSIELADLKRHKLLSGANFVISFVKDEK
jgi:signal transduction histidine kinase